MIDQIIKVMMHNLTTIKVAKKNLIAERTGNLIQKYRGYNHI